MYNNATGSHQSSHTFDSTEIPTRFSPEPNTHIGKYRVDKLLGEGSFGIVYKVEDSNSRKPYALKLLKMWDVAYQKEREQLMVRFKLEYETSQIDSQYLVRSFDCGKQNGNPYILMEFCSQGDLRKIANDSSNPDKIHQYATQILKGLDVLHQQGKVHRDLKPENVLLDEAGAAKLTDFGIVGHANMRLTKKDLFGKPTQIFGTIAYMAPEQLEPRDASKLPTIDIFAFGVMTYELLTGVFPFGPLESNSDLANYCERVKKGSYERPTNKRRDIPVFWDTVMDACLQPNPKNRIQSVHELLSLIGEAPEVRLPKNWLNFHQAKLQIMQGEEYGKLIELGTLAHEKGKLLLKMGRKDSSIDNDIAILEENTSYISRRHATFEKSDHNREWFIRDGQWNFEANQWQKSTNGVFVNSKQVDDYHPIRPDDIVTIGDTTLKVIER